MRTPLTGIEKMVWASTFALALQDNIKTVPTADLNDPTWLRHCRTRAMRTAYRTVISLRKNIGDFLIPSPDPEDTSEPHEMVKFLAELGFSTEDDRT